MICISSAVEQNGPVTTTNNSKTNHLQPTPHKLRSSAQSNYTTYRDYPSSSAAVLPVYRRVHGDKTSCAKHPRPAHDIFRSLLFPYGLCLQGNSVLKRLWNFAVASRLPVALRKNFSSSTYRFMLSFHGRRRTCVAVHMTPPVPLLPPRAFELEARFADFHDCGLGCSLLLWWIVRLDLCSFAWWWQEIQGVRGTLLFQDKRRERETTAYSESPAHHL